MDESKTKIIICNCEKGISYTEEFTDMIFEVDDGNEIAVHQQYLALRCEYFKTMFYGGCDESKKSRMQINNVKYSFLKIIIHYLYTGLYKGTLKEAPEIYCVAHSMGIKDATEKISFLMADNVSHQNFATYINCAFQFNLPYLKEICCKFWCKEFRDLNYDMRSLSNDAMIGLKNYETNSNGAQKTELQYVYKCEKGIYYTEEFTDVVLVVEGNEIAVHRQVFALHSEYFKIMFYGQFAESKQTRIQLNDMKWTIFKKLVDYIYTGKLEATVEDAQEIYLLAHMLRLCDANTRISRFMADKITKDNFVEYANFAYEFDDFTLASACFYFSLVSKDIEEEIEKLSEDVMLGFLDFSVPQFEINKFRMACTWLKGNDKSKAKKLMSKINLSYFTMEELRETVWPTGYFTTKKSL